MRISDWSSDVCSSDLIVIADDGLQHLALGRDLEIAVQDARGIGNGRVLPAGPLRAPADRLNYVDFLITNLPPGALDAAPIEPPAQQLTMRPMPVQAVQLTTRLHPDRPPWRDEPAPPPA